MTRYTNCPICDGKDIHAVMTAKDFTVSQKIFSIWHCNSCTLRFTQDIPDEKEIGVYYASDDYISHSNTKKGLINNLYHLVRQRTLFSKRRLVIKESGKKKGNILDIGCGTGAFLHTMQDGGWTTTGLEPDMNARAKALELYKIHTEVPGKLFQLEPASFDGITLWHVLEHVHDLHGYIQQLHKLLAPGGKLFIAVPNYTSLDAATYKECWAAYDLPRHLYHFSPSSMKQLLARYNFNILSLQPMWFDSFYVSMLSEKYRNGKVNLIKAFWNGFLSNLRAIGDKRRCSSVIYIGTKFEV